MARSLLNHLSDWAIGTIFIGLSIAIALLGAWLMRRFLPRWRAAHSAEQVVGVAQMAMTMFALVLAFVVVNLYSGFESAVANVSAEANSLSTLVRDAEVFPSAERGRIDRAVAAYAEEVRNREFALLRYGREDPEARSRLALVFSAMQGYSPVTEAQRAFYGSAADELNAVADARHKRLEAAETSIPAPLLALIVLSGAVLLGTSLLIRAHRPGVDIALLMGVAVIVGVGLFTALVLEYPFSGSIAVGSAPFAHVAAGV